MQLAGGALNWMKVNVRTWAFMLRTSFQDKMAGF
jgi:hypothetical protein